MDWPLVRASVGLAVFLAAIGGALSIRESQALATTLTAKDNAKAKQARQLYKEGQYEDAAKLFSSLSTDYPDKLAFTRNLGACYYHLRRPEPAISNLREYLRLVQNLSPADRSEVEGWIAEMEQFRDHPPSPAAGATEPPPTTTVPPAALVPSPALPFPVVAQATKKESAKESEPASPAVVDSAKTSFAPAQATAPADAPVSVLPTAAHADTGNAPTEPVHSGRGLRIAGVACGAAGLASLGTAVYFYTRAVSLSNKVTTSPAPTADDHQAGKNAETLQWVFYSVGGAALATGSILYYLGWRESGSHPAVATIAPMVGAGLTGLSAQGVF
jgi:tetratricopeptide (TPR) repeat protein